MSVLLIINAVMLLLSLAMIVRPGWFMSGSISTERGIRLIGVLFGMASAANLIDRLN